VPRLLLKFEGAVTREIPLGNGGKPVTIGRAPDNDIQIDNLVVSDHHARIVADRGWLKLEDLQSLNGTSINGNRITQELLRSGDEITIGKHLLVVDLEHDVTAFVDNRVKVAVPKLDETYVLDSRPQSGLGYHPGIAASNDSPPSRARIPSLLVLKGKTTAKHFLLSSRLTLIGKSPMATVQLRGWFAPKAAAQVTKRPDGYYFSPTSKRAAAVNGKPITTPTRLNEGDLIDIVGVSLKFVYLD
jgi:pSer/pThr/pTyr-binding forkhead associated (FHA) protein